jgi:hypothetical protein
MFELMCPILSVEDQSDIKNATVDPSAEWDGLCDSWYMFSNTTSEQ